MQQHTPRADTPTIETRWSRRAVLGAAATLGTGLLVGCTTSSSGQDAADGDFAFDQATPVGQLIPPERRAVAPTVTGELLDGSQFDPAVYQDKVLVLNFWGSWCAPCRVETPEFQLVFDDLGSEGAYFLGVAVKDQRQLAQAFYDDFGITYPSLFDPSGEVALAFRDFPANVVPTTILIDRQNRVAATYVAVVPEADLRGALKGLLD